MNILLYILVFILAFVATEFAAWFSHKYIMHGFLWNLHKDHHVSTGGHLEHNDWFAVIFAVPSVVFIFAGLKYAYPLVLSIGLGMAAYGIAYFLVHDVFIHQRIKWFRNTSNGYLQAIRRAHKMHHKKTGKHGAESFGFLIVGAKYFKQQSNSLFDKKQL